MLTPAEAEKLILDNITSFHREDSPLMHAHGRVLRQDLRADRDLPPFDRVTPLVRSRDAHDAVGFDPQSVILGGLEHRVRSSL